MYSLLILVLRGDQMGQVWLVKDFSLHKGIKANTSMGLKFAALLLQWYRLCILVR
jgi:hypothetical protein